MSVGQFAIAIYAGLLLVIAIVYPLLLRANGLSPLSFHRAALPAIELAFVSRSSIGTLPVTQDVVEHRLGVPPTYAAFAVPLGATTKMDGCAAIYPAISAIFVAQFYGIHLGIDDYLLIVFVSVLGSAATAGLTGATVMLTLSTLGLPLDGVGLLLAIDPILDMGRTAVNVGDMFERLTRGRFRSAPHRVVNRAGVSRLSSPLFFDPDFAASVEPLPIEDGVSGIEARWDDVDLRAEIGTYGDYLLGKVSKVFPELAGTKLASR